MRHFFCIGDLDTCSGFNLAGVSGVTPDSYEEAKNAFFSAVTDSNNAVLIITEEIAERLQVEISEHRMSGKMPMIVEVPENLSGEYKGQSLMDSIKKAIGISI